MLLYGAQQLREATPWGKAAKYLIRAGIVWHVLAEEIARQAKDIT